MHGLRDLLYVAFYSVLDLGLFVLRLWRRLRGRQPMWPPRRVLVIHTEGRKEELSRIKQQMKQQAAEPSQTQSP